MAGIQFKVEGRLVPAATVPGPRGPKGDKGDPGTGGGGGASFVPYEQGIAEAGALFRGEWQSGVRYRWGEFVSFDGVLLRCEAMNDTTQNPSSSGMVLAAGTMPYGFMEDLQGLYGLEPTAKVTAGTETLRVQMPLNPQSAGFPMDQMIMIIPPAIGAGAEGRIVSGEFDTGWTPVMEAIPGVFYGLVAMGVPLGELSVSLRNAQGVNITDQLDLFPKRQAAGLATVRGFTVVSEQTGETVTPRADGAIPQIALISMGPMWTPVFQAGSGGGGGTGPDSTGVASGMVPRADGNNGWYFDYFPEPFNSNGVPDGQIAYANGFGGLRWAAPEAKVTDGPWISPGFNRYNPRLSMYFKGAWQQAWYGSGDIVTHGGALWVCEGTTFGEPGFGTTPVSSVWIGTAATAAPWAPASTIEKLPAEAVKLRAYIGQTADRPKAGASSRFRLLTQFINMNDEMRISSTDGRFDTGWRNWEYWQYTHPYTEFTFDSEDGVTADPPRTLDIEIRDVTSQASVLAERMILAPNGQLVGRGATGDETGNAHYSTVAYPDSNFQATGVPFIGWAIQTQPWRKLFDLSGGGLPNVGSNGQVLGVADGEWAAIDPPKAILSETAATVNLGTLGPTGVVTFPLSDLPDIYSIHRLDVDGWTSNQYRVTVYLNEDYLAADAGRAVDVAPEGFHGVVWDGLLQAEVSALYGLTIRPIQPFATGHRVPDYYGTKKDPVVRIEMLGGFGASNNIRLFWH